MQYHVTRNGQNYGPYTMDDLRRYVAEGNILPTDLARSDEMADWVPVSQILAIAPGGSAFAGGAAPPSGYAQPLPPGYGAPGAYPDAPDLAWGLVLLFGLLTCSLFMIVWNLVISSWLKRVQPNSTAVVYYGAAAALSVVQMILGSEMHVWAGDLTSIYHVHPTTGLLALVVWVVRLVARFNMRASLEEHFNGPEPVGLRLSGVMTFFFGGIYFQYHLNKINEFKRVARYRGAAI